MDNFSIGGLTKDTTATLHRIDGEAKESAYLRGGPVYTGTLEVAIKRAVAAGASERWRFSISTDETGLILPEDFPALIAGLGIGFD